MKTVKLYLGTSGYCCAKESHAIRGGENRLIKFYALFGLLLHPDKGWILYDTGYARRFYEATRKFPDRFYAMATKVLVTEENEVKSQLLRFGLSPGDIKYIIITHFHADHIGGLKDFEKATIFCSKIAYESAKTISSVFAFAKGILKSLIPVNFENRLCFIENITPKTTDPFLGNEYDLFDDRSLLVYMLPGHAAGQIGVLLKTEKQTYLLAADSCWSKKAYEDLILPNPVVRLFFDSWQDYKTTLTAVHQYHKNNPVTVIVPTHCLETMTYLNLIENKLNEV